MKKGLLSLSSFGLRLLIMQRSYFCKVSVSPNIVLVLESKSYIVSVLSLYLLS